MLRSDTLGTASVIRDLALREDCYETMIHFFRASSWSIDGIRQRWFDTVLKFAPLYKVDGCTILIGDGVKKAKERKQQKMPKEYRQIEGYKAPFYKGLEVQFGGGWCNTPPTL